MKTKENQETSRNIEGNQNGPVHHFAFTFTQPFADLLCHFLKTSETQQIQKVGYGYVRSCEAAKRGGEAMPSSLLRAVL